MVKKIKVENRFPNDSSGKLFEAIKKEFGIEKEGKDGLADFLGVDYTQISKIRHGHYPVSDTIILLVLRATGWPLSKVDKLMGIKS